MGVAGTDCKNPSDYILLGGKRNLERAENALLFRIGLGKFGNRNLIVDLVAEQCAFKFLRQR